MSNKSKKTKAKAYGLKQIVVSGDDLYASQFAKGNDYKLVKLVKKDDQVITINDSIFDIESNNQRLDLTKELKESGATDKVSINNPLLSSQKQDYLRLKSFLETEFFGEKFDDNIHIQIIYAIMDIKKILSLYVYNTVYSINHLCRDRQSDNKEGEEFQANDKDIIGMMHYREKYDDGRNIGNYYIFEERAKGYLGYFPVLKSPKEMRQLFPRTDKKAVERLSKIHNYNCLRVLCYLRNCVAHNDVSMMSELFTNNGIKADLKDFINTTFDRELAKINSSFVANAKKNLNIIGRVIKKPINLSLLDSYYNFSIIKEQKNLGVNLKKLKEEIYNVLLSEYKVSVKPLDNYELHLMPKINLVYEYILWDYFRNNSDALEEMVEKLRLSINDEEKDSVYHLFALKMIETFKPLLIDGGGSRVTSIVRNLAQEKDLPFPNLILDKVIKGDDFPLFAKIIYIISDFLTGKEKNELLTSLINKIDNIYLFISILEKDLHEKVVFKDKYKLFNEPSCAESLRLVRNISKASKVYDETSQTLYRDALLSLGVTNEDTIKQEIEKMENAPKGRHQFRNFIINNVIKSNRFQYIVKYSDPSVTRAIITSNEITDFVFKKLPDEQIDRYYSSVFGFDKKTREEKESRLAIRLREFTYQNLIDSKDVIDDARSRRNIYRERLKAVAGLYYTVAYLVVKSLIKVNSIYSIAFSAFERDNHLVMKNNGVSDEDIEKYFKKRIIWGDKSLFLLNHYLNIENFYKKHDKEWITKDKNEYNNICKEIKNIKSDDESRIPFFRRVRNITMHMEVIKELKSYSSSITHMDSYYELYQTILQNLMVKEYQELKALGQISNKDKSYSRNILKIIYLPLAYNLARYKNITIEDIFILKIIRL